MISWTVTALPVVPTASYSFSGSSTAADSFDATGEEKFTAAGGSSSSISRLTSSNGNQFSTEFGSITGNDGFSFYNSDGGLDLDNSNSVDLFFEAKTTQSWNGAFTVSYEDNDTSFSSAATSSTYSSTRETSTTETATAFNVALGGATTTAIAGTTIATNSATLPTTTTRTVTTVAVGGTSATTTFQVTTAESFMQTGWANGGAPKFPTVSANTFYSNVTQAVFYSVTNAADDFFYNQAETRSGDFTLSSSFRTGSGNVVTITESSTFTATENQTTSVTEPRSITQATTTASFLYAPQNSLPLTGGNISFPITQITTTASTITGVVFGTDLPTTTTAATRTGYFVADLDIERTITYADGTETAATTAAFFTVQSSSSSTSSGPADFNGAPSSGSSGGTITENSGWQETFSTGYNLSFGNAGQSVAGSYFVNAWAAASSFLQRGRLVAANIGSVTMPSLVRGNQTVFAFVGSTSYSNSNGFYTVSANGRDVALTRATGTLRETSSAQLAIQQSPATRVFVSEATAGGGNAASGTLTVARFPGVYYTSNQSGISGTQFLSNGQSALVAASNSKIAALSAPYYVGSNGNQWLFTTERNYRDI